MYILRGTSILQAKKGTLKVVIQDDLYMQTNKETNKHVKRMSNEPSSHQLAGFVATGAVPTAGFGPVVPDELPKPQINQHTQILISIINRGPDSPPVAPSEQREQAALVLVSFHVEGQVV